MVPVPVTGVVWSLVAASSVKVSSASVSVSFTVGTRTLTPFSLPAGTVAVNLPSLSGVTGVQVVPPSVLTSTGAPVSVPRVAVPPFRVRLTSVSTVGLSTATSNTKTSPSATFGLLTLFTSAVAGALSLSLMAVVTSLTAPSLTPFDGLLRPMVKVSLPSASLSSAVFSVSLTSVCPAGMVRVLTNGWADASKSASLVSLWVSVTVTVVSSVRASLRRMV